MTEIRHREGTFGTNSASQRTLEKAGFTLETRLEGTLVKNGRVEDEWICAFRR
ncbi:MAG: hypothetical protein IPL77_22000 [Flavobacteriales bacterium]|nr:hypothetical protein [Flavobacteriales bacterium]